MEIQSRFDDFLKIQKTRNSYDINNKTLVDDFERLGNKKEYNDHGMLPQVFALSNDDCIGELIIDTFGSLLFRGTKHAYFLCNINTVLMRKNLNDPESKVFSYLRTWVKKEKIDLLKQFKSFVVPFNTSNKLKGGHWIFIGIKLNDEGIFRITVFDSYDFGHNLLKEHLERVIDVIIRFIYKNNTDKKKIKMNKPVQYEYFFIRKIQNDGHNCGPWVMKLMKMYLEADGDITKMKKIYVKDEENLVDFKESLSTFFKIFNSKTEKKKN